MSFLNPTGVTTLWSRMMNYLTGSHVKTEVVSGATDVDGALNKLNSEIDGLVATDTALESGLAIVANGNTHAEITSGQYVYVKNHSTLVEGLYKASATIATNEALNSSNVTIATGELNSLISDFKAGFTTIEIPAHGSSTVNIVFDSQVVANYVPIIMQSSNYAYTDLFFGSTNRTANGFVITASSNRSSDIMTNIMWAIIPF